MPTKKSVSKKPEPEGVQSASVSLRILKVLIESRGPLYLREIAGGASMAPSNVYRYLVSFLQAGMIAQDGATGQYDLGPLAIQLGLAALRRVDVIDIAVQGLTPLIESTNADAHICVWGSAGPTVVRWRGRPGDVAVKVNEGLVLPLISSATGRVWSAFQTPDVLKPLFDRELAAVSSAAKSTRERALAELTKATDKIERTGVSFSSGERRMGIDAICAPVFDRDDRIVLTITLLGTEGRLDPKPGSTTVRALLSSARGISMRIGCSAEIFLRFSE